MTIGLRLGAAADFVPFGSIIADIGTDHAYLPIELVRSGRCPKAIAGDYNKGPCAGARHSVAAANLTDKIDVRLGSGLEILAPGEADIAIFCGMGGSLIKQLLTDSSAVVESLKGLILQPQQAYSSLRRYLYEIGWQIADESLIKEDGRLYQVIYAVPGRSDMPSDIDLEVGPVLNKKRPALFAELINELLQKTRRSLSGMEKSPAAAQSRKYDELKQHAAQLEALL